MIYNSNNPISEMEKAIQSLPVEIIYRIEQDYLKTLNILEILSLLRQKSHWNSIIKSIFQTCPFQILHLQSMSFPKLICRIGSIDGEVILSSEEFRQLVYYLQYNDIHPECLKFGRLGKDGREVDKCLVSISEMMLRNNDLETLIRLCKKIGSIELHPDDMDILFNYDLHLKFFNISLPVIKLYPWPNEYGNFKLSKFKSLEKITFEIIDIDCIKWCQSLLISSDFDDRTSDPRAYLSRLPNLAQIIFQIRFDWYSTSSLTESIFDSLSRSVDYFTSIHNIQINIETYTKFDYRGAFSNSADLDTNLDPMILKYFSTRITKFSIEAVESEHWYNQDEEKEAYLECRKQIEWLGECTHVQDLEFHFLKGSILDSNDFMHYSDTLRSFKLSGYKFQCNHERQDWSEPGHQLSFAQFKNLKSIKIQNSELPASFFRSIPESLQYFYCEGLEISDYIQGFDGIYYLVDIKLPKFLKTLHWKNSMYFPKILEPIPFHLQELIIDDIAMEHQLNYLPYLSHLTNLFPQLTTTKFILQSTGNSNFTIPKFLPFSNITALEIRNNHSTGITSPPRNVHDFSKEMNLFNLPCFFIQFLKVDLIQITSISGSFPKSLLSLDINIHNNDLSILSEASTSWQIKSLTIRYSGSNDLYMNSITLSTISSLFLKIKGNRVNVVKIHSLNSCLQLFNIETDRGSKIPKLIVPRFTSKLRELGVARSFNAVEELNERF